MTRLLIAIFLMSCAAPTAQTSQANHPNPAPVAHSANSGPLADWSLTTEFDALVGFSADGTLYAVKSSIGHEEIPGIPAYWINFIEVRETTSHKPIAVYPDEPSEIDEDWGEVTVEDVLDEDELEAFYYWERLRKDHPKPADLAQFNIEPPKRLSNESIQIRTEGKPPGNTKFVATLEESIRYRWDGFDDSVRQGNSESPWVVVLVDDIEIFRWRPRYQAEEVLDMADMDVPWVDGELTVYAFGTPRRYAFVATTQVHDVHEEMDSMYSTELGFTAR